MWKITRRSVAVAKLTLNLRQRGNKKFAANKSLVTGSNTDLERIVLARQTIPRLWHRGEIDGDFIRRVAAGNRHVYRHDRSYLAGSRRQAIKCQQIIRSFLSRVSFLTARGISNRGIGINTDQRLDRGKTLFQQGSDPKFNDWTRMVLATCD